MIASEYYAAVCLAWALGFGVGYIGGRLISSMIRP